MTLLEKYKPKKLSELLIQREKITELKRFIVERKPVILTGPTGCGKTSLVYLLAQDMNYELLEINASDKRNKLHIEEILGPAVKEGSLFAMGRLVLIDDIEALSGTGDRGGIQAIIILLQQTNWPIVLTTTSPISQKLNILRKKTGLVELEPVDKMAMAAYLAHICEQEQVIYDPLSIEKLVIKSRGDVRAAMSDLETSTISGVLNIDDEVNERDQRWSIQNALHLIFRRGELKKVLECFYNADVDLDEAMLWLDENIPREFSKKEEIFRAYQTLSKADIFNKRISKRQYWRFLVYRNFFMTVGISRSGNSFSMEMPSYKRSTRPLKYFWENQKNTKKKYIAQKIAEYTHTSYSKTLKETLPFIFQIYKSGHGISILNLTEEEKEWIANRN